MNYASDDILNQKLAECGLRSTRQREVVFQILLQKRDHSTAYDVFARVKEEMPTISLATVYNCLETLVQCDLIKQVNFEREPTRYCPNLSEHAHFHDADTGKVVDVDVDHRLLDQLKSILPEDFEVNSVEINFRGRARASNAPLTFTTIHERSRDQEPNG
jgi:Fur family transcriptional regulator, peroxide stress response regulator